ncbi:uncharacterized protein [Leptinotarsa decemlineata]|uniref:uncharacterized protein n=1 Tax=Leptinotarsa decemlineata TaxID=7539 RepID=UPI003D30B593
MPPECSVYTGELHAIAEAIKLSTNLNAKDSVIFTDSLSSSQSIKQPYPKHPILKNIKTQLYEMRLQGKNIELVWIPSHIGIPGNEEADVAAKEASADPSAKIISKIPYTDMKPVIKTYIRNIWHDRWHKNQNNKLLQINPNLNPVQYMGMCRRYQVILTRLRTGHTKLTHQHLLQRDVARKCETCQTNLDVNHILLDCPSYQRQRRASGLPGDLREILTPQNIDRLVTFLKCINILCDI